MNPKIFNSQILLCLNWNLLSTLQDCQAQTGSPLAFGFSNKCFSKCLHFDMHRKIRTQSKM